MVNNQTFQKGKIQHSLKILNSAFNGDFYQKVENSENVKYIPNYAIKRQLFKEELSNVILRKVGNKPPYSKLYIRSKYILIYIFICFTMRQFKKCFLKQSSRIGSIGVYRFGIKKGDKS